MSEYDETTTHGDDELIELDAPPAPPTRLERPSGALEGDEADEDGAGTAAPAPSSTDTEEDAETDAPSSVSIRERMRQLDERDAGDPGSPGLGVVGKFSEARAERDAQDEDA